MSKERTYIYWDNSSQQGGEEILRVYAKTLTEADDVFKQITGVDPRKKSTVGVQITGVGCVVLDRPCFLTGN